MISFLNKITQASLPPTVEVSSAHFEKAKVYISILLFLCCFLVTYSVYYLFNEVNYHFKHLSNWIGVLLIGVSFLILKRTGSIEKSALPVALIGLGLIVVNGYHSGGNLASQNMSTARTRSNALICIARDLAVIVTSTLLRVLN